MSYKGTELLCINHEGDDPGFPGPRCPICELTEARDALADALAKHAESIQQTALYAETWLGAGEQAEKLKAIAAEVVRLLDAHAPGWRGR